MSTIWNRAWLLLQIAFFPVIMTKRWAFSFHLV